MNRTKTIHARLTDAEIKRMKKAMRISRQTQSEFIREAIGLTCGAVEFTHTAEKAANDGNK